MRNAECDAIRAPRLWTPDFFLIVLGNGVFFSTLFMLIPVLPRYLIRLGGSAEDVGLATGLSAMCAVVARLPAGVLSDRWRVKPLLVMGSLAAGVSCLALVVARSTETVYLARMLHGAALGVFSTAAGARAAEIVPEKRRVEGLGWFGITAIVAMAVAPVAAEPTFSAFGFRTGFLIVGGIALTSGLVALFLGKEKKAEKKPGLLFNAAALRPYSQWIKISKGAIFPSLIGLSGAYGLSGVMTFAPLVGQRIGFKDTGLFYTALALFQILARLTTGRFADRLPRRTLAWPSMMFVTASLVTFSLSQGVVSFLVAAVLLGLGWGTFVPPILAMAIDLSHPTDRGAAMATFFLAIDLGVGIGNTLIGTMMERWSFSGAFLFAAALSLSGMGLLLVGTSSKRTAAQMHRYVKS